MDVLPSAKFRKVYATLRNPTAVTVNGHVIGQWVPGVVVAIENIDKALAPLRQAIDHVERDPSFAQFRPAPKSGHRQPR